MIPKFELCYKVYVVSYITKHRSSSDHKDQKINYLGFIPIRERATLMEHPMAEKYPKYLIAPPFLNLAH